MRPFDDISRLERAHSLDKPAAAIRTVVQKALVNQSQGLPARHLAGPLAAPRAGPGHVRLAVLGQLIDLVGGKRSYSSALIGTGLAVAPVTAAAGWADWSAGNPTSSASGWCTRPQHRRAVALRRGAGVALPRRRGRLLSLSGLALSSLGAVLGGHLAYHQGLGPNHADRVADLAPSDWTPIGSLAELPDGEPVRRRAGEEPVLVVRRGAQVTVLSNTCPHLAAPLSEGRVEDGDIVCPWHGSRFRLSDGELVQGPATASVPCFETRVADGALEVRRRDL
jgi:nitrite reductase/ring-hydroxylating ferredoxin subunit